MSRDGLCVAKVIREFMLFSFYQSIRFRGTPPSKDRTRVIMAIGRKRAENIDFLMRASASASERLEI
jgi:hypothetical protein